MVTRPRLHRKWSPLAVAIEATTPSGKVASRQIKSASVDNGSPQLYQVTIMARYVCSVCGFIYDENQEGVSWEALPKDWACPGCGSDQSLFNLLDDDKADGPGTSHIRCAGFPNCKKHCRRADPRTDPCFGSGRP